MKPGFSALDLVMSMAVSAILMTSILEIYYQVTRNMMRVERFVYEDSQILTLKNRMGKDFSGMSAIWFTQGQVESKQLLDGKKMDAPEKRKRSNYFYSVNKNKHLDVLTFVTTSALQFYGTAQDRFVRVVYQVEEDPDHKDLFSLMRKEIPLPTENIDEETLKKGTSYELVRGIKTIETTYYFIDKIELQKQQQAHLKALDGQEKQEQQGQAKPIIRSVKQWGMADQNNKKDEQAKELSDEDDESEEKQDLGGAAVPKFVEIKIVFGATDKQFEQEYVVEFIIPCTLDNIPKNMVTTKKSYNNPGENKEPIKEEASKNKTPTREYSLRSGLSYSK